VELFDSHMETIITRQMHEQEAQVTDIIVIRRPVLRARTEIIQDTTFNEQCLSRVHNQH
jgi:hypothetical protein